MRQRRDQEPVLPWQCALLVGYLKLSTMVGIFQIFSKYFRQMCHINSKSIFKLLKVVTKYYIIIHILLRINKHEKPFSHYIIVIQYFLGHAFYLTCF